MVLEDDLYRDDVPADQWPTPTPRAGTQYYEAHCRNPECDFEGGTVDVTIDYRTPYETGYTWVCPRCGMTISSEHSSGFGDD